MRYAAIIVALAAVAARADEPMGLQQGVSWKEYVDQRFADRMLADVVKSAEIDRRLEQMNEVRAQMGDMQATFALKVTVDGLAKRLDNFEGRNEGKEYTWAAISAVAGLVIGAAGVALTVARSARK